MSTEPELTPAESMTDAEQAVMTALVGPPDGCEYDPELVRQVQATAQRVVAAVRPILAAEALREEAAVLEEAIAASAEPTMFVVPAHLWLRDRAALRTTTPEDTK